MFLENEGILYRSMGFQHCSNDRRHASEVNGAAFRKPTVPVCATCKTVFENHHIYDGLGTACRVWHGLIYSCAGMQPLLRSRLRTQGVPHKIPQTSWRARTYYILCASSRSSGSKKYKSRTRNDRFPKKERALAMH